MTSQLRTAASACVVLACLGGFQPHAVRGSHSWGNYHWSRTRNPVTLKVGSSVSGSWRGFLTTAVNDWRQSKVIKPQVSSGQSNSSSCRAKRDRIEVCNGAYGFNGWEGLATIWTSGAHITQATAKMNDSYLDSESAAEKQLVMCQEIGHGFGLDHQDENFFNAPLGTCMDYTVDPTPNQHPNAHDFAQLEEIYRHTDKKKKAAGTAMPQAMAEYDVVGTGQLGRFVRAGNDGRTELYELDFGGGHKVFNFVIRPRHDR